MECLNGSTWHSFRIIFPVNYRLSYVKNSLIEYILFSCNISVIDTIVCYKNLFWLAFWFSFLVVTVWSCRYLHKLKLHIGWLVAHNFNTQFLIAVQLETFLIEKKNTPENCKTLLFTLSISWWKFILQTSWIPRYLKHSTSSFGCHFSIIWPVFFNFYGPTVAHGHELFNI